MRKSSGSFEDLAVRHKIDLVGKGGHSDVKRIGMNEG
jgi:hypothetical protein